MIVAIFDRNVSIFADHPPNWSALPIATIYVVYTGMYLLLLLFFLQVDDPSHDATLLILIKARAVCLWASVSSPRRLSHVLLFIWKGGCGSGRGSQIWPHYGGSFLARWWVLHGWLVAGGRCPTEASPNDNDNWSDLNANNGVGNAHTHAFAVGCHDPSHVRRCCTWLMGFTQGKGTNFELFADCRAKLQNLFLDGNRLNIIFQHDLIKLFHP